MWQTALVLLLNLASQGATLGSIQLLHGSVSPCDNLKPLSRVFKALGDQPVLRPLDEQCLLNVHSEAHHED